MSLPRTPSGPITDHFSTDPVTGETVERHDSMLSTQETPVLNLRDHEKRTSPPAAAHEVVVEGIVSNVLNTLQEGVKHRGTVDVGLETALNTDGSNVVEHPTFRRTLTDIEVEEAKTKQRETIFNDLNTAIEELNYLLITDASEGETEPLVHEIYFLTNHLIDFVLPDIISDLLIEGEITMKDVNGWLTWAQPVSIMFDGKNARITSKQRDDIGFVYAIELENGSQFETLGQLMIIQTFDDKKEIGYNIAFQNKHNKMNTVTINSSRKNAGILTPVEIRDIANYVMHLAIALKNLNNENRDSSSEKQA